MQKILHHLNREAAISTIFLFRFNANSVHTHFRIFAGPDRLHLLYCGYVCMRNEEWNVFMAMIESLPNVYFVSTDSFIDDVEKMNEDGFIEID